jgi:hypothetical protein
MKKVFVIFMMFVGLLAFSAVEVHADPLLTVTSTDGLVVAPSAEFEVVVSLEDATDIVGFQLELLFDVEQFTYEGVAGSASLGGSIISNDTTAGVLKLNYVDINTPLNGAVDLFTLTFTASDDLDQGEQPVITASPTYNNEFISLDAMDTLTKISDPVFDFNDVTMGMFGDVNLDGEVSIIDAGLIQLEIAELTVFSDVQEKLADVNQDGEISILDVGMIQQYIAGILDELPPVE